MLDKSEALAIKIEGLKKEYRLGAIGGTTLTAELQSKWAKMKGKEDPNSLIGMDQSQIGSKFYALNGINLEIKKGEAVGIIGHNGAGKSTLLKILSQVTAPTEGTVKLKGRVTSMLEVGTGFHPELTGRENIYMNGAILGMSKSEIYSKIDEIIEFSECSKFIDTPVKRYSSGMYVKLAFSVAAHLDSEIMIMDEVLAVGDMAFQKKCLDKMKRLAEVDGKTVLYVSHNMNTIIRLCNRCIVLDKGRVVFDGSADEGVSVYMENNDNSIKNSRIIDKIVRPENSINVATMRYIEVVNSENCIFERGQKIRFKLEWKAEQFLEDVQLRIIIDYSNGAAVGVAQSDILGAYKKDEEIETYFEFDTSFLAEGKYYVSISLFQKDEVGNIILLDHVLRPLSFSILFGSEDPEKVKWEHMWWGSVCLPPLKLCK